MQKLIQQSIITIINPNHSVWSDKTIQICLTKPCSLTRLHNNMTIIYQSFSLCRHPQHWNNFYRLATNQNMCGAWTWNMSDDSLQRSSESVGFHNYTHCPQLHISYMNYKDPQRLLVFTIISTTLHSIHAFNDSAMFLGQQHSHNRHLSSSICS